MRLIPAVLAVSVLALPAAAEDLTIVANVTSSKGTPKTATTYMSGARFRHGDGEHDSIVDLQTGRMTMVDHAKKQYYEITREELAAMAAKQAERMKQMQEQMKNNPQAAAMMEKMMGGPMGEVSVQKGTEHKKIAGYDCEQYTVAMGEAVRMEVWATPSLQPPAEMFDARKAFMPAGGPMAERMAKMIEEMKKVKGYPLGETMTIKMGPMSSTTTTEATEVKKGAIDPAVYLVPAAYKKVDSPAKKMMSEGAPH